MAWTPAQDTRAMTAQEFLQYAEREIPGISTNPELKPYLGLLQATLDQMDPVRVRARARQRGMLSALTRQQHIEVLKSSIRRTPKQAAEAVDARTNPIAVLRHLRRLRRNGKGPVLAYGGNIPRMWELLTKNTYESKDLPLLAVREALQNSRDAINKAVEQRKIKKGEGRFDVVVDRTQNALIFRDNGTGMDAKIIQSFLSIGESDKYNEALARGDFDASISLAVRRYKRGLNANDGAYYIRLNGLLQFQQPKKSYDKTLDYDYTLDYATSGTTGGFGVAKAVILGCSADRSWEIRTQDLFATSEQLNKQEPIETDMPYVAGVELTVFKVPHFDRVTYQDSYGYTIVEDYDPIEVRIRKMLSLNNLPDVTLTLNGEVVTPYFDGRRGMTVDLDSPGLSALQGRSGVPGTEGYPFNTGRDKFNTRAELRAFDSFRDFCEKKVTVKEDKEDEMYDPRASSTMPPEQEEIQKKVAEALGDADVLSIVQAGAKVARDFRNEQAAGGERKLGAKLKAQVREEKAGDVASDHVPETPQNPQRVATPTEKAMDRALDQGDEIREAEQRRVDPTEIYRISVTVLTDYLKAYNEIASKKRYSEIHRDVFSVLAEQLRRPYRLYLADLNLLYQALDTVQDNAARPEVGGISFALSVESALTDVLNDLLRFGLVDQYDIDDAKRQRLFGNPFGAFAGLLISRKQFLNKDGKYNSEGARKFKKEYAKYLPVLVLWDQLLRMVIDTYGQVTGRVYPGFVLNDDVIAIYIPKISTIGVNPFFFKEAKKGYNNSRDLAAYLHGLICHELAHYQYGVSHGDGHDEGFSIIREDIAFRTYPLIPAFSRLLSVVLDMPDPERQSIQTAEQKLRRELKVAQSCPKCYQQLIETLEQDGRLDTIEWLKKA